MAQRATQKEAGKDTALHKIDGMRNGGYLVKNRDGKVGRTYYQKGLINGKIPVYLCIEFKTIKDHPSLKTPLKFSDTAILCDPKTLRHIGFID